MGDEFGELAMTWDEEVRDLIEARWQFGEAFQLGEVYDFEPFLATRHDSNRHVRDKLRQALQHLRDHGVVEFLGNDGTYQRRIPGDASTPITVEQVYERLRAIARARSLASYSAIYGDPHQAHARASRELGRIALAEHEAGRPLLSVVAVAKGTNRPSRGLFQLALDHDSGKSPCPCGAKLLLADEDEPALVGRQLALVYAAWSAVRGTIGRPFVDLPDAPVSRGTTTLELDLDLIERGSAAHRGLQNRLANYLRDHGAAPRRPERGDPLYDLAWSIDEHDWVAEVKSLRGANETQQLRIGLGQVIQYAARLRATTRNIHLALVIEREPRDLTWIDVCASVGVTLSWPDRFDVLLT